jgi:hypothetical protein
MLLTCTEEEYPGYKRQTFECSVCGGTMTLFRPVQLEGLVRAQPMIREQERSKSFLVPTLNTRLSGPGASTQGRLALSFMFLSHSLRGP